VPGPVDALLLGRDDRRPVPFGEMFARHRGDGPPETNHRNGSFDTPDRVRCRPNRHRSGRREWPIGGALDDSASPADRRDVEETTLKLLLHTNIHHHSLTIFHT